MRKKQKRRQTLNWKFIWVFKWIFTFFLIISFCAALFFIFMSVLSAIKNVKLPQNDRKLNEFSFLTESYMIIAFFYTGSQRISIDLHSSIWFRQYDNTSATSSFSTQKAKQQITLQNATASSQMSIFFVCSRFVTCEYIASHGLASVEWLWSLNAPHDSLGNGKEELRPTKNKVKPHEKKKHKQSLEISRCHQHTCLSLYIFFSNASCMHISTNFFISLIFTFSPSSTVFSSLLLLRYRKCCDL